MITINPINNTKVTFTNNKQNTKVQMDNRAGLMSLDKKPGNRINFEKDLHATQNADMVQSNPIKALGYNVIKAYNILCTPKRRAAQTESNYNHIPFMYMA